MRRCARTAAIPQSKATGAIATSTMLGRNHAQCVKAIPAANNHAA